MIREFMKEVTKKSVDWLGETLGLPDPVQKGLEKVTGSLFTKQVGGSEFQIIDTSVQQPRFGGRLGFNASRMAGGAKGYAETVNPETLYAAWDRRLGKYYSDKYKVARTVIGKKRVV
jgi:hypothetical protein